MDIQTLNAVNDSVAAPVTLIYQLGSLTFDAWLSEKHTSEIEVTSNPVETGVSISDHCYRKPKGLTIAAAVSDISMPTASGDFDDTSTTRSRRAFELLIEQQESCTSGDPNALLTVITGLKQYENMICTSITATRDAETARMLSFEAELCEVIMVSTQQVTYTPLAPKAGKTARQATPVANKGQEQAVKPPDVSSATALFNGAKKLFHLGG
jgi:hypothetical protein